MKFRGIFRQFGQKVMDRELQMNVYITPSLINVWTIFKADIFKMVSMLEIGFILTYSDLDHCLNPATYCDCLLYIIPPSQACITKSNAVSGDVRTHYSEINGKIFLI